MNPLQLVFKFFLSFNNSIRLGSVDVSGLWIGKKNLTFGGLTHGSVSIVFAITFYTLSFFFPISSLR